MRLHSSPPIPRSPSPTSPAARRHWLEQQIAALTERLCSEFAPTGGEPAESVRRLVREVHDGFGSPTVLTYLPILIEHAVRNRLRASAGKVQL